MKAVTFQGKKKIQMKEVTTPTVMKNTDILVKITGVYGSEANWFPLGDFFTRNVSLKMGQATVVHLMPVLYEMIEKEMFDPTDIITHKMKLEEAINAYRIFDDKSEGSIKTIFKP